MLFIKPLRCLGSTSNSGQTKHLASCAASGLRQRQAAPEVTQTKAAIRFALHAVGCTKRPAQHGRAGGIRTHDLLNPIQAHYQAVLRPDAKESQDAAPKRRFQAGKTSIQQETIKRAPAKPSENDHRFSWSNNSAKRVLFPDSGLNHCGSWWRLPPIPGRALARPGNSSARP
jgi:hypothetical protein